MSVFSEEVKKFTRKQKGVLVLFGLVVVQVLLWTQTVNVPNLKIELVKQDYFQIAEACGLHGAPDEAAETAFSQYQSDLSKASDDLTAQSEALSAGEIDYSTYLQNIKGNPFSNEKWTAAEQLKQQMDYVKGDPAARYITYTNGWEILFSHSGNYLTAVFVLVLAALLFCPEYENQMQCFLRTTPNGTGRTVFAKLVLEMLGIAVFVLASEAGYALYLYRNFGLPDAHFPVQSLPSFANCPYALSILETFCLCVSLKILTCMVIGLTASFIYVLLKKVYSGTIAALLVCVLPAFLQGKTTLFIPLVSFLQSELYFKGLETDTGLFLVPFDRLLLLIGGTVLCIAVLWAGTTALWKKKSV